MLLVLAVGCSDDAEGESGTEGGAPAPPVPSAPTVAVPVDDTPFCRAMREADTTGDSVSDIVAIYADVSADVPPDIRPDFDVVLERMVAISRGDDVADPARAEESAIELAAYIERRCRGTSVSPLPPPTAPHDGDR